MSGESLLTDGLDIALPACAERAWAIVSAVP